MRALIQRVSHGRVSVAGRVVGQIDHGLVILLGVAAGDTEAEARWLAQKCAGLRVFDDPDGKMNLSLEDVAGAALVISQFTLYGDARRGRRPSFTVAAPPESAAPLVQSFCRQLEAAGVPVATGRFGAAMEVVIHNDGPVTLLLEREAGAGR